MRADVADGSSGDMLGPSREVRFYTAGSSGRCNTGIKLFGWGCKSQGCTWPFVELPSHFVELCLRVHGQVDPLRKVTAAGDRWCSHCNHAATDIADRRSKRRYWSLTSTADEWSQGIDATLYLGRTRWSGCDGAGVCSRFWCGGEGGVVGALAAWGVAEGDWANVWQTVIVDLFEVAPHGGIRPAPRRRSRLAMTLAEREEISRGIAGARSMRSMARLLGHAPSTVSREIKRNGGYDRY